MFSFNNEAVQYDHNGRRFGIAVIDIAVRLHCYNSGGEVGVRLCDGEACVGHAGVVINSKDRHTGSSLVGVVGIHNGIIGILAQRVAV